MLFFYLKQCLAILNIMPYSVTADPLFASLASAAAISAIIAATADPFFAILAAMCSMTAIMMYAVEQVYIKWIAMKNAEAKRTEDKRVKLAEEVAAYEDFRPWY